MLNKELIFINYRKALEESGMTERKLAARMDRRPDSFNQSTNGEKLYALPFLQNIADALDIDVERIVVPGLTKAAQYINHGNFDQSRGKHSKVSGFATDPHQAPILHKAADPELQQKLYESQENRISLLEQISSLKDEINALKIELNNCKNAL